MDLGIQFFTAAKAQHESGAKWSLIVLIVLAYLHLAIVGPFAAQTADIAAIEQDLALHQEAERHLAPVVILAADFVATVESEVKDASDALLNDKIGRFRALDGIVRQLAALGPLDAQGQAGALLFEPEIPVSYQQQQQPPPPAAGSSLLPMPAPLRGRVAEAALTVNMDPDPEYMTELERYITDAIIMPAFDRANESWASERLPALVTSAARLDGSIEGAAKSASAAAAPLNELQTAVRALREQAERFRFVPPSGSDWWRSVAGKETSIAAMFQAMNQGIHSIGQRHGELRAAQQQAASAIAETQARAKDAAARLAELEQQARDLQAQLGEIGQPLKVISVRLSVLAPLLPLVIALAIGALLLWRAESLRRMSFAVTLVANDVEGNVLRRWLAAAAGGSARLVAMREIALGAVAIAWVAAAWLSVRALPAPLMSDGALVGIALTLVVAGRAYHWHRCHQVLAAADRK